jgi:hypothetical protein
VTRSIILLAVLSHAAFAAPDADAPTATAPLAQIKDGKQLTEALTAITQDPAIPVDDPNARTLAQALMIEGVKQLQLKSYDQALANFLEAYGKFPSPKILLNIASTLRDMGRLSDAANTYQRYLTDPQTGSERVSEVKDLLLKLDEQLTILTIRVAPRLSDVSIDAGAFIPVGSTLVTRVRPGIHMVRIRKNDKISELSINGFEGENKEVLASIKLEIPDPADPVKDPVKAQPKADPPDSQNGWLIDGRYSQKSGGSGNQRGVLTRPAGETVAAIVPAFDVFADGHVEVRHPKETISSGVVGVLRIDAEGRGFAGGLGFAIARGRFEGDIMVLRSNVTGGYLGARYRILNGFFRPYVAAGIPGFVFDNIDSGGMTEKKLAIGARVAGGLELFINGHLSVQADIGFEHFWFVDNTPYVANVWVPTVGVIGRM